MPIELKIAALGALLLFVHIFAATRFKTAQYGRKWNVGARDETLPPANPMTGRMMRAQANFEETFPIAIIALLGVVVAGRTSEWTAIGGWIWLGACAYTWFAPALFKRMVGGGLSTRNAVLRATVLPSRPSTLTRTRAWPGADGTH